MSASDPNIPVHEGELVADKYRVVRVLGVGGMGVVVEAVHLDLDERVALKFLLPEGRANAAVTARFSQEARAAVKIKSEHVARVIDVGKLANGSPFMVMEYLDGEDLEHVIAARGALPVEVAVGYVLQACEALAEAHALGIVHRDLKPANLFLTRRPSGPPIVKVLDFGISKTLGPMSRAQLTQTSSVLGSPLYMSPEQMSASKSVDQRSDLWALGVVLFELLSGAVPFCGESMPELVVSVVSTAPRSLSSLRPDVPAALEAVVMRCLMKVPAERFADVGELARALAPFAPGTSAVSVTRIEHLLGPAPAAVSASPENAGAAARVGASSVSGIVDDRRASSPVVAGEASRLGSEGDAVRPAPATGVRLVVGAAVVALLGGVAFVARPTTTVAVVSSTTASPRVPDPSAVGPSVVAVPPSTGAPTSAPTPASEPSATPTPAASSNESRTDRATSLTIAPEARGSERRLGVSATSMPVPVPAPAVDCNPAYVIDPTTGHHTYKPECLQ